MSNRTSMELKLFESEKHGRGCVKDVSMSNRTSMELKHLLQINLLCTALWSQCLIEPVWN